MSKDSGIEGAPTSGETPGAALWELARLFFRLGATAFGGPAAHVAMMEDEVVRRRGWMTREDFLDLYGATNLIPGPSSTELAIHIGHRRAGWAGLLVAGGCFIVPAALITLGFAWAYVRFGAVPEMSALLYGVKPVIIAVVAQALWGLGRAGLRSRPSLGLAALCAGASLFGIHELAVLAGAGVLAVSHRLAAGRLAGPPPGAAAVAVPLAVPLASGAAATAAAVGVPFGLLPLFLFFAKVGSVLFGSGYVLLAFLRADLVERYRWMTEAQLLDAVAVGQVTPGPVFTAATFIGYLLGRVPGALVATAGIFVPAFFFVALSGPLIPRVRRSPVASAFLDGVNAASLALMAVVSFHLARAAVVDWLTGALAIAAALLLIRYRVSSLWLILAGAVIGVASVHV
ncbi:chromate transport protein [Sorangium cellulosum So ce56]|uniref:Chromate transport protein n=1 Tax=Sorangium cellulosum (strain So ce56) TaxID=448385 RepID=A9GDW8_SORC5|nr:chromate efflux transporter [Sorangium cellulosum]CAN99410.1 chromate transport protein [Sorangium cellulosum So ce56]